MHTCIGYTRKVEMLVRTYLLCSNILSFVSATLVTLKVGKMSICCASNHQPCSTTILAANCNSAAQWESRNIGCLFPMYKESIASEEVRLNLPFLLKLPRILHFGKEEGVAN